MSFLITRIREQAILEMDVNLDNFIKENGISESAMIHTMVFDKEVFVEEKEVREYLQDKYMCDPSITDDGKFFTAVLLSPNQMDMETEVTIEIRRGVTAIAADFLPTMSFEDVCFNDKGEINLSSKFGTIDLSDGLPHIIEVMQVAEGEHPSYGKLKITQEHLESIVNNFNSKATGVDLAVNEDHKKNEAFGWFKDLYLSYDKQKVYGQVQWNTKGVQALSEKEYRYFSPEFRFNYVHPLTQAELGTTLLGGALTNYPFLKMDAITELSNKQKKEGKIMDTIDMKIHNEEVVELNGKINKVQIDLNEKIAENGILQTKVKTLEDTIELNAKKSSYQKLFDAGTISAAQLKASEEGKNDFEILALSAKVNTTPKGDGGTPLETVELSEREKKTAKDMGVEEKDYKATKF